VDNLKDLSIDLMKNQHFDSLAVGVIDFEKFSFESFEIHDKKRFVSKSDEFFFDLASLTKPLTLSTVYLKSPELFDEKMELLLSHRGGLPSGGRITTHQWRKYLEEFEIIKSETVYSDYSALRLMVELEKKSGKSIQELASYYFDKKMKWWTELEDEFNFPSYGDRTGRKISGEVHDDNAYYLNEPVSHAGLFATVDGLCQSLLNLEKEVALLKQMDNFWKDHDGSRFLKGWDTVSDFENTLAGKGCGKRTFGHLGFTGTSIWIDLDRKLGSVILSNATQNYWYDRDGLRELRQRLGHEIWGC